MNCFKNFLCPTMLWFFVWNTCSAQERDSSSDFATIAEQSNYESTATHAQVMELCQILSKRSVIDLQSMGKSFEKRDLPLLVLSMNGSVKSPADVPSDTLVVFVMANIHAGEVCGKEALLMIADRLSRNDGAPLLKDMVLLLAPIYNADGNERFSKDNRPGQIGPANGMGQRHNAQDLDLNRDNVKHESSEARALAKLISDWDPDICIDTHTTNGSIHRYTITYDGPRHPATPAGLVEFTRDEYLPAVGEQLAKTQYLSFFYGNFNRPHDRWDTYPDYPRYCTHYFGMRGTVGILSEAYAYASYKDRVLGTRDFVLSCLTTALDRKEAIQALRANALAADQKATEVPIQSVSVPLGHFDVLGYVETTVDGKRTKTDQTKDYRAEYFGVSRPTKKVTKPYAYAIDTKHETVLDVLRSHGIAVKRLGAAIEVRCEQYSIQAGELPERAFQGHRMLNITGTTRNSLQTKLPAGTAIIETDQPYLGGFIVNLLEPESSDGLCAWNFFDQDLLLEGQIKKGAKFPVLRVPDKLNKVTWAPSAQP